MDNFKDALYIYQSYEYTYQVKWSVEDNEFVGTCLEFPSLSFLDTKMTDSLVGIRELIFYCLKDLYKESLQFQRQG
jgi:hypothetical protein